ncbi:MAG: HEAT repeat domain-containing protein [Methanobrevibacter sp.]|jgi:HEAT repeat protein/curved DNA-binding protein CbpA|nr:HEAT repeat domain-containing protein [Candidatus Methanovirga meridionalis]
MAIDYYKILGISKETNQNEIKKAYRDLVLKFHPDVNEEDTTEKFKEINEAYHILLDNLEWNRKYQEHEKMSGFRYENPISDDDLKSLISQLVNSLKNSSLDVRQQAALDFMNYSKGSGHYKDYSFFSYSSIGQSNANRFNKCCREVAFDSIIERLKYENDIFVIHALFDCLGNLNDDRAIMPLIEYLKFVEEPYPVGQEPYHIGQILIKINSEKTVNPLISMIDTVNEKIKRIIFFVLGKLGYENIVNTLIQHLNEKDIYTRRRVVEALGNIGDKKALNYLTEMLNDEAAVVRKSAVISLIQIGSSDTFDLVINMLNDKSMSVKKTTIWSLGQFGDSNVANMLIKFLDDESDTIKKVTINSLAEIGNEETIKHLEIILNNNVDRYIRESAYIAIGKIKYKSLYGNLTNSIKKINVVKSRIKNQFFEVPEWNVYYPSLNDATKEQKEFYELWKSEYEKNNYLYINENFSYIFVFLYEVINNFIENEDINYLLYNFDKIEEGYGIYTKIADYLVRWKIDAYLFLGDKEKGLKIQLDELNKTDKHHDLREFLRITAILNNKDISLINGDILVKMYSNVLSKFGKNHQEEIKTLASNILNEFKELNTKDILHYFIDEFCHEELMDSDYIKLKSYFPTKSAFQEEKNNFWVSKENINLGFNGFTGVPVGAGGLSIKINYDKNGELNVVKSNKNYRDKFNRDEKILFIPGIARRALQIELKVILRKSENILRMEKGQESIKERLANF